MKQSKNKKPAQGISGNSPAPPETKKSKQSNGQSQQQLQQQQQQYEQMQSQQQQQYAQQLMNMQQQQQQQQMYMNGGNPNNGYSNIMLEAPMTSYSGKSNNFNNNNNNNGSMSVPFIGEEGLLGGESVKVALRIRPMNNLEKSRGDENCVKVVSENSIQINLNIIAWKRVQFDKDETTYFVFDFKRGQQKSYRFNYVLDENTTQSEAFLNCGVGELLESSLDGYSATIFAYGQTGSGKTYTMAGIEEKMGRDVYVSDDTEGIIPRAIRYLWQAMAQREEQFYVKASFTEIYNEQIRDLLNPASGILHCRWNVKNGFFVEDLMIVECTNVDDMIAVLHEGMKNRKTGAHELNKDSSRSHTILTVYLISELVSGEQTMKRYGKLSFVDLAGSERLKESKSHGDMIKETGNINKSLFTLGKVIQSLSDKKAKQPYVPYRDSKLTMLLMDSLGGTAKALMIACAGPSGVYYDETFSTMNYAARTMNIKNKPIVQMDQKDQIIYNLQREIELLTMENKYLREQLARVSSGFPLEGPDQPSSSNGRKSLPPLAKNPKQSTSRPISNDGLQMDLPVNKIVQEYQFELNRMKSENEELRNAREIAEKNYHVVMNNNNALQIKLENIERVFIGNPANKGDIQKDKMSDEYMASALMLENSELKKNITELQQKNIDLSAIIKKNLNGATAASPEDLWEMMQIKQQNQQLQQRVEFLQTREKDLLQDLMKLQKEQTRNN